MRKDLGKKTIVMPMPVFIVSTFNEDNSVNAMNAAWGGVYDYNKIMISLSKHKTTNNLEKRKAFCVSLANEKLVKESDYFGLVSGNKVQKIAKTGLKVEKSKYVDAPIIIDYPLTFECEVESFIDGTLIGNIINVSVDSSYVDENGKIDIDAMKLITYDPINNEYRLIGKSIAKAFEIGNLIK